jgi:hypothetical protein
MRRRVSTLPAVIAATVSLWGCGVDAGLDRPGLASGTERFKTLTDAAPLPEGHPALPGRHPALPDGHPPIPEAHRACPGSGALPQWGLDRRPTGEASAPPIIST